jgi:pilus assembly protein CpaE
MAESESIKVLFADDNDSKVEGVTRLLHFESDIRVIGHARSGPEALEMLGDLKPDVVLMDPGLPPKDGFQTTRELISSDPLAQVVMLSLESDAEGVRSAMRAGAVDFVSNYINGDKLAQAVRNAAQRGERLHHVTGQLPPLEQVLPAQAGPQGKVIAFFAPRGGAGVTTLAVNMALALNSSESPAVLVDADMQFGDVCAFLNLQPTVSIVDMTMQAESLDDELIRELLLSHDSGLRVVAAPVAPELADDVTPSGLSAVLRALRRSFAYVVVDAGSYLTDSALTVIEEADLVVSIVLPEIPSIKNAKLLLDVFFKLDLPRDKLVLVMNKMDKREAISRERVSDNLKHPVIAEIPFDREAVKGSINRGQPLITDQKTHPLMRPLLGLAGEIKEKLLAPEEVEAG